MEHYSVAFATASMLATTIAPVFGMVDRHPSFLCAMNLVAVWGNVTTLLGNVTTLLGNVTALKALSQLACFYLTSFDKFLLLSFLN